MPACPSETPPRLPRVLIVDDAVTVRRLLSNLIADDPLLAVAGTAASGNIALSKIAQDQPDLVVLDVEMPGLDGLQTLASIRRDHPWLPVVMFSSMTRRGALATLDALALGAQDYVPKPEGLGSLDASLAYLRENLLPKLHALTAGRSRSTEAQARSASMVATPNACMPRAGLPPRAHAAGPVEVVVVAASTGGPAALTRLMAGLPADLKVPVLIVQHMPPLFTPLLAERLNRISPLTVSEAIDGMPTRPGQVYLAPGNFHLALQNSREEVVVSTHQGPLENSCRPAADVLFRSAVEVYGPGVLGVVMTGMGQDGLCGSRGIVEAGGQVLVQDEATSVVWGMPGAVARAGLADGIVPLGDLGVEIGLRVGRGRSRPAAARRCIS